MASKLVSLLFALAVLSHVVVRTSAWTTPPAVSYHSASRTRTFSAGWQLKAGGPATIEAPTKETVKEKVVKDEEKVTSGYTRKGGWAVRLFNDGMNKREFVAMCLSQIVGLTDGQAYQVMMQAHKNGVAVIGRFDFERAELYKVTLVEHGLLCDMIPVDDD
jgi:ATP-dependent Clp protease adaptor protein ClpS